MEAEVQGGLPKGGGWAGGSGGVDGGGGGRGGCGGAGGGGGKDSCRILFVSPKSKADWSSDRTQAPVTVPSTAVSAGEPSARLAPAGAAHG